MSFKPYIYGYILTILLLSLQPVMAQTGFELDIKKPEPYENRELRAERTGQKKFTIRRRIFQNTYTHYNYFFNANNKLNEIINGAKASHIDNYAELLPFYNYTLDVTSQQKEQLDSVIYKSKTGIVMHDLRNDWIDDLYLLWGAAYFFQKELDSAHQMFQFINYAFAEKEKDGFYRYIGSRMDGGTGQSIVTKEDDKLLKRIISDPPSRNNAFIWQIRTFIEGNAMPEAASMIATLKNDPNFPERLEPSLAEVQALWYYKQERWDSAAAYLSAALDNAKNKQERARWEYLIGQLYGKVGKEADAKEWFSKAIDDTHDPVLDIYARLNLIRFNKEGGDDYVSQNIAELAKMARRERYIDYRDVIYLMMAQMEMERNNPDAAQKYLEKGAEFSKENPASRNRTYLALADFAYTQKKYIEASAYYDSLQVDEQIPPNELDRINSRKDFLSRLVNSLNTIQHQDSMQRIAKLPEEERTDYLKKLSRRLRKQRGLKEEETVSAEIAAVVNNASDPFRNESKGEWYFYNKAARDRGTTTFKQVWGNRPNADNWRRGSSVMAELRASLPQNTRGVPAVGLDVNTGVITYETLLASLPLTPEQVKVSNDSIQISLLEAGDIYFNKIEDYSAAIQTYEEFRRRFPDFADMSQVLFNLYYAYQKSGDAAKAEEMKRLLLQKYPESRYASIVNKGVDPLSSRPAAEVTKTYEGIYDMFIEGRFEEAKVAKQIADSMYQTNYWSPQLLYIESVYHIRQNEDSIAMQILQTLINQGPESPMAAKAITMLDVLSRRKEIEEELRNLQIERPQEEETPQQTIVKAPDTSRIQDTTATVAQEEPQTLIRRDTSAIAKTLTPQKEARDPRSPEARKEVVKVPDVPTIKDTTIKVNEIMDSVAVTQAEEPQEPAKKEEPKTIEEPTVRRDTTSAKPVDATVTAKPTAYGFTYDTDAPHYAVVILNKVDNIFGNEARNAFNRFSKETYVNQVPNAQLLPFDAENKLVLIGIFGDFLQAVDYIQKAKPIAASQIVPWLKAEKYTFTVISESNLEVLKSNPNLANYEKFLEQFSKLKW